METAAPGPAGGRCREPRRHALLAVIGEVGTEPERGALRAALERGIRSWNINILSCDLNQQLRLFVTRHLAQFSSEVKESLELVWVEEGLSDLLLSIPAYRRVALKQLESSRQINGFGTNQEFQLTIGVLSCSLGVIVREASVQCPLNLREPDRGLNLVTVVMGVEKEMAAELCVTVECPMYGYWQMYVILMLLFIMVREVLTGITVMRHVPHICAAPVLVDVLMDDLGYSVNAEITELAADLKLLIVTTSRAGYEE
ncbi:microtubule-associated protein 1a [Limosa lapponica baueri]|uniref:Microtubule-associated protein 1a n=1 Tax=Limosa lapponica baueri TaxID=1758121 RepID=A0A2I0U3Z0_LIMLA|nr:microtubule-associated protein 1a [Limosa lapponica baueri]